jgi:hypothetical protein
MTISSENRKSGPFLGTGAVTEYPFDFTVFSAEDLIIVVADVSGAESTLVLSADYTVVLNGNQDSTPGGTVVLADPLADDFRLVITSGIEALQPTDLTNQGGFYPRVVTRSLDRLTILVQQLKERMSRAVVSPISSGQSGQDYLDDLSIGLGAQAATAAVAEVGEQLEVLSNRTDVLEGSALLLNHRGDWATATAYVYTPGVRRDIFRYAVTGVAYFTLVSHTSTSIAADEAAGHIVSTDAVQLAVELAATMVDVTALETHVTNLAGEGAGNGGNLVGLADSPTSGSFSTVQGFVSLWSARQAQIDLRAGMDAIYGAGLWTERTAVGVGSDIGPALQHLMDNSPARTPIYIPPGSWRYVTPVPSGKLDGRRIYGVGSQGSRIVYGSATGYAFNYKGEGLMTGGGLFGLAIQLEEGLGNTGAQAIRLDGAAGYAPAQMHFQDLYITALGAEGVGASYWNSAFMALAAGRTAPQGVRIAMLENIQMFRCHNTGMFLQNAVQFTIDNCGAYSGLGNGMTIYLAGGGSALQNSIQVYARALACSQLNVTNTSKFDITGTFSTFATDASATSGRVVGFGAALSGVLGANVSFTSIA